MTIIKHHHIRFFSPPSGPPAEWESLLRVVSGVTEISIDAVERDVYVEYDLARCCEEAVERWMVHEGFTLDDRLVERLKRGWIHFTEANEREALRMPPYSSLGIENKAGSKRG